jgi:hypothetical protein
MTPKESIAAQIEGQAAQPAPTVQEPVAWMHEWDDGERVPMLRKRDVDSSDIDSPKSVRPLIFGDTTQPAAQPAPVNRDAQEAPFEEWWEREGQFGRAGGGQYEKTFAWNAWCAALATPPAQPAPVDFETWFSSGERLNDVPKDDYPITYLGMEKLAKDSMRYAWNAAKGITKGQP